MNTTLFDEITHGDELEPTPSYPFRSWHWVASESLLTIRVQKGKGVGTRSELDVYQVQEVPADGFPGRVFLLTNLSDDQSPDTYQTFVGEGIGSCTCPAGKYRRHDDCKHISSLRAAVAAGCFEKREPLTAR